MTDHRVLSYIAELERFADFCSGEGPDQDWPPELVEWRQLKKISPGDRSIDQIDRLRSLARGIMVKGDARKLWGYLEALGIDMDALIASEWGKDDGKN